MKMTVADRIHLSELFPEKGNLVTLQLVEDIRKKTVMDQAEMKEINFKVVEGGKGYVWGRDDKGKDIAFAKEKEFKFTELELNMLRDKITIMDKAEEITATLAPLCKKIQDEK